MRSRAAPRRLTLQVAAGPPCRHRPGLLGAPAHVAGGRGQGSGLGIVLQRLDAFDIDQLFLGTTFLGATKAAADSFFLPRGRVRFPPSPPGMVVFPAPPFRERTTDAVTTVS